MQPAGSVPRPAIPSVSGAPGWAEGGERAGGRAGSRAGEAGRAAYIGGRGLNPRSRPRPGQVAEDELVSTLKHLVSEKLNVPVRQQRLLFKGKALAGNRDGR